MRGLSKPVTLNLVIADQGGGSGYVQGVVPFDLKDYGMTSSSKIGERGEVDLNLKAEQVSGLELIRKKVTRWPTISLHQPQWNRGK